MRKCVHSQPMVSGFLLDIFSTRGEDDSPSTLSVPEKGFASHLGT